MYPSQLGADGESLPAKCTDGENIEGKEMENTSTPQQLLTPTPAATNDDDNMLDHFPSPPATEPIKMELSTQSLSSDFVLVNPSAGAATAVAQDLSRGMYAVRTPLSHITSVIRHSDSNCLTINATEGSSFPPLSFSGNDVMDFWKQLENVMILDRYYENIILCSSLLLCEDLRAMPICTLLMCVLESNANHHQQHQKFL